MYKFLLQYREAYESYRQAMEFSERYLGPQDGITANLTQIYNKARNEIDSQLERNAAKAKRRELINE